jgi:hypothetical protein
MLLHFSGYAPEAAEEISAKALNYSLLTLKVR